MLFSRPENRSDYLNSYLGDRLAITDEETQCVYWCEPVPNDSARGQIFSLHLTQVKEPTPVLPNGYSCKLRPYEYGGGSFNINKGLIVFYSDEDYCLYSIDMICSPSRVKALTKKNDIINQYTDMRLDENNTTITCIWEEYPNLDEYPDYYFHSDQVDERDILQTPVTIKLSNKQIQKIPGFKMRDQVICVLRAPMEESVKSRLIDTFIKARMGDDFWHFVDDTFHRLDNEFHFYVIWDARSVIDETFLLVRNWDSASFRCHLDHVCFVTGGISFGGNALENYFSAVDDGVYRQPAYACDRIHC